MDNDNVDTYQIVLEKIPEEKQQETALFLSGCFSLPPVSTRGIAASAPIALVAGLTRPQTDAILAELSPSLPAGVVMTVSPDGTANISRLQWPRPPRIYGRPLKDFIPEETPETLVCPLCRGRLRLTRDENGVGLAPAGEKHARSPASPPTPDDDNDPLFSGLRPLAPGAAGFASIRSLQAGDTGFWVNYNRDDPPAPAPAPDAGHPSETGSGKRATSRGAAGLSAFMKPGVFAVVLGRTRDAQVVKMAAEIMGVNENEARDRCLNLSVCVVKGIALDEAQSLLSRFRGLGAKARIVKPM